MQTRDWIEIILSIFGGIGILFLGLGYVYSQFKQGSNQNQLDNDSIYKGRIEALELQAKSQSEDIDKLTEQVKKLRADNDEANRKLLEAMNILQNRNPELVSFMKEGNSYMLQTSPILDTLKRYLDKQVI